MENKYFRSNFPSFVSQAVDKLSKLYQPPRYENFVVTDVFLSPHGCRTYDDEIGKPNALILFSVVHHSQLADDDYAIDDVPIRVYSFAYVAPGMFQVGAYTNGVNTFQHTHYTIEADKAALAGYEKEHAEAYRNGYECGFEEDKVSERNLFNIENASAKDNDGEELHENRGMKGKIAEYEEGKIWTVPIVWGEDYNDWHELGDGEDEDDYYDCALPSEEDYFNNDDDYDDSYEDDDDHKDGILISADFRVGTPNGVSEPPLNSAPTTPNSDAEGEDI